VTGHIGAPGSFARLCEEHPALVRFLAEHEGIWSWSDKAVENHIEEHGRKHNVTFSPMEIETLQTWADAGRRTPGQQIVWENYTRGQKESRS
jgi:hypothetical protein